MKFFSYGTLQSHQSQRDALGKEIHGHPATITGWRLDEVMLNGETYPNIVEDTGSVVHGTVYDLSDADVAKLDKWEVDYDKTSETTDDGENVFVYVMKPDTKFRDAMENIKQLDEVLAECVIAGYIEIFG